MLHIDDRQLRAALGWPDLIAALREAFRTGRPGPMRHHHDIAGPAGPAGTLLLMPAFGDGGHLGVKLVTIFPDNAARSLPTIAALYALFDARDGRLLATLDGGELTARRTAAASALAASYLARADAETHLIVGTGRLCGNLAAAHRAVRPLRRTLVWGRRADAAVAAARALADSGLAAEAVADLAAACGRADIVSCATPSRAPLVHGAWLRPGTHLDLIGAFKPEMRETDDDAIARADLIVVDSRAEAMAEAGDLLQPLRTGRIAESAIAGDLFDLCRRGDLVRPRADSITVFKSVGTAIEDLAAAVVAYRAHATA